MEHIAVSVIVPIYNAEPWLEECVQSILDQDFPASYGTIEVLLIDDGATDGSGALCDRLAKRDNRIKVVHQENQGLSGARNTGIDMARGRYYAFIDSDDVVRPAYLKKMYEACEAHDAYMAICAVEDVQENGKPLPEPVFTPPTQEGVFRGKDLLNDFYAPNGTYYTVAWNKLYRAEVWKLLHYPEGRLHEDDFVAHCGGSGSTTTDSSSAADTTATAASYYESAQKPDKLVWWVHDGMHQEDGSEQWIAEFDAKTGIDLELDFIDNNEYTKKLELAYASDTVPDTFDLNGETLGNYAAQGAIADLTDLVHESGLYDKVDKNLWDALTVNGKIYGVPRETPSAIVTYVRKDWLDRLGMDVPTTYDEFIEMLTRFKNEIPECTAPYTAPGLKSTQALPEFYQGATADYVKVDGKWVDGMAQDNMLTALQNLQDAYTAGLIDQEAITNTTSACRDEWYAGTVGCFPYWGGLWGETLTVRLKQNVPDAEVIALPPIEGATYLYSAPSVQVISSKLSDEQVASVFKYFIEYMHDGDEGSRAATILTRCPLSPSLPRLSARHGSRLGWPSPR